MTLPSVDPVATHAARPDSHRGNRVMQQLLELEASDPSAAHALVLLLRRLTIDLAAARAATAADRARDAVDALLAAIASAVDTNERELIAKEIARLTPDGQLSLADLAAGALDATKARP